MTVERIREAILAEAREEAERIESEATERHEEHLDQARRELEEEFEHRFEKRRRHAEQQAEREVLQRRSEHNLALLRRRNEILDDLFRRAARALAELPDEEYRRTVEEGMVELPEDAGGEVLCNEKDADRLRPLIERLNAERDEGTALTLIPGDEPALGGVIFRSEMFEIDLSLETRVEDLREELAPRVAEMVFPKDLSL